MSIAPHASHTSHTSDDAVATDEAKSLDATPAQVREAFEALQAGYEEAGGLAYAQRMDCLSRLEESIRGRQDDIAEAISADFGNRSHHETAIAETYIVLANIRYLKRHLKGWMKPRRRHTSILFAPATNKVLPQPLGVVGIIAPWNYPFQLAMVPIITAMAAGNRVLLKPSELTPRTSALMAEIISELFSPRVAAVVMGGAEVGVAFSKLPFGHLLFTGSTAVGKHIMRAAADNLTPVTLELGGKSPTIIHPDYDMEAAVERIATGKLLNAGQTCVAPDYVLVQRQQVDAFVSAFKAQVAKSYPTLAGNPDYTTVINAQHFSRLKGYVADALAKGARTEVINPADETLSAASRKFEPTLLLDVTDEMKVMQEEIFGPVLPVVPYDSLEDAIGYINARPRPLALYYFDRDRARAKRVLEHTVSGGACVNETMVHCVQDDAPFGGVGPSGMGAYHGKEGFETFSHMKTVFHQARINGMNLLSPPFTKRHDRILSFLLRRDSK